MNTPKNATAAEPSYQKNPSYVLNVRVRAAIRGAVAEIDLAQVAISANCAKSPGVLRRF